MNGNKGFGYLQFHLWAIKDLDISNSLAVTKDLDISNSFGGNKGFGFLEFIGGNKGFGSLMVTNNIRSLSFIHGKQGRIAQFVFSPCKRNINLCSTYHHG
jgi:hypothetical protein